VFSTNVVNDKANDEQADRHDLQGRGADKYTVVYHLNKL